MSDYFPCSVCEEQCEDHCILCETCQTWCHFRCQNISKLDRKIWDQPSLQYVCISCRNTPDGSFDYNKGIERLSHDAVDGLGQLKTGVNREQLFIKNVPFDTSLHTDFGSQSQDTIANAILSDYYVSKKVALKSTRNGDCLFNSFSLHIAGNESRSTELRYRCCIEMVSSRDRMIRHRLFRTMDENTPDIDVETLKCATKGNWSSMWHIMAVSNLLKVKVSVAYPAVNGTENYYFRSMNQTFKPTFVDPEKATIDIMWTSITAPPKNGFGKPKTTNWTPNHFVPLVTTNQPMKKVQLKAATYESSTCKQISTTARSPITIGDYIVKEKTKRKRNRNVDIGAQKRTGVGKGSRKTLPGVLHTDVSVHYIEHNSNVNATTSGNDVIHTYDVNDTDSDTDVTVMEKREGNRKVGIGAQKRTGVGKGSRKTLPGVLHTDVSVHSIEHDSNVNQTKSGNDVIPTYDVNHIESGTDVSVHSIEHNSNVNATTSGNDVIHTYDVNDTDSDTDVTVMEKREGNRKVDIGAQKRTGVGKGSRKTLPGVLHTDVSVHSIEHDSNVNQTKSGNDVIPTYDVNHIESGTDVSVHSIEHNSNVNATTSGNVIHTYDVNDTDSDTDVTVMEKREVNRKVDIGAQKRTGVGKGSRKTLPGVLHTDVSVHYIEHDSNVNQTKSVNDVIPTYESGTDVISTEPENHAEQPDSEFHSTDHDSDLNPTESGNIPTYDVNDTDSIEPSETSMLQGEQWSGQLSTIQEESFSIQEFPTEEAGDNDVDVLMDSSNLVSEKNNNLNTNNIPEDDFTPGPLKTFMDFDAIITIMKGPHTALDEIPIGQKEGMYYVLDNNSNIERRNVGQRSDFWDDCGTWTKASTPNTIYMYRDSKWTSIRKYKGQYCMIKYQNKKAEYTPLQQQPTKDEVITVRRLYQSLKATSEETGSFKRRITWVEKEETTLPEISNAIAIVEYVGVFPQRSAHGLVQDKENSAAYVRTRPDVINKLKNSLTHRSVKDVERELNKGKNDFEKQRNEKQLYNTKQCVKKDHNQTVAKNIADQIICVEEMTKTHEFVKSVKHISGMKHPLVTLFTEQQMIDIKRFCCRDNGVVLGMDKTYNLGEFHVTQTVYKDKSVLRRSTQDHPICFGPSFIHQSSTAKAYQYFLNDIAVNLNDTEMSNLTVGSDEELAFKCAIKRCFHGCTHVLCTRHLKENTNRHMQNIVGYPESDRVEIVNAIYGKNGLIQNTDVDTLSHRVSELTTIIEKRDESVGERKFMPYFKNKLMPLLKEHVIEPVKRGKICGTWTNNNCESANHILKSATGWKMQDMPRFIETLYSIVSSEQEERCRAVRDTGNYRLAERYSHHKTDISYWASMSEENRHKRMNRFLSDMGKERGGGQPTGN